MPLSHFNSLVRAPSLPPSDDDLYKCSCHISDVTTLAVMLNVSSDELDEIKKMYPSKKFQALQLLKKWRESTGGSYQELSQYLTNLNMKKAAKRFVAISYPQLTTIIFLALAVLMMTSVP